jgi:CheY-like chemotaxis protein
MMQTILIIDDDPDTAEIVRSEIQRRGHVAMIALDGADALRRLADVIPTAILLDLAMPGLDALQILGLVRTQPAYAHTRIVCCAAPNTTVDPARLTAAGITEVSIKGSDDFLRVVDRLLADDPAKPPGA